MKPHDYQRDAIGKTHVALESTGRALVVMATGLGKTIVGAFATERLLNLGKGLFLCHLNSGLEQSVKRFKEVFGDRLHLGLFHGSQKDFEEVDILFASFQTLRGWKHAFFEDEFDYIIVDESHHGWARTFKEVLDYFKPKALLALTATPDRMDEKDIRDIFGEAVVDISLEEGIGRGWLSDVEYHLLSDNLNRFTLRKIAQNVLHGKKISMKQLNETIFIEARDEEIAKTIRCYGKKKTIIFCEGTDHADNFQKFLPGSKVYHSKKSDKENEKTLNEFRAGECQCLLVVDKMNECIDVPDVEIIVFLRCTDSKTVFLHQLGRGLRKTLEKRKVIVLDFVANAERVTMIREIIQRVGSFTSNQMDWETDPHYVKGKGFEFVFTDEQIDLFDILDRLRPRFISDSPELSQEYSENNPIPAYKVGFGSDLRCEWKCAKCSYVWKTVVRERTAKTFTGCPACSGKVPTLTHNLLTLYPVIAAEYSEENTTPVEQVMPYSGQKYWWKCPVCDHKWKAVCGNRTRHGNGCPRCRDGRYVVSRVLPQTDKSSVRIRGNLSSNVELAKRYSERNTIPVNEASLGSHKKAWWECIHCNHEWQSPPRYRNKKGIKCPKCGK